MGNYKFKPGYGQALVDLLAVSPTYCKFDPTSIGVQFERVTSISGVEVLQGLGYVEWLFAPTPYTEFDALMAALGLSLTAVSTQVTIYTLQKGSTMTRYNSIAHYPIVGSGIEKGQNSNQAYRSFTLRFTRLVPL